MAEKLTESSWTGFTKKLKLDLDDDALVKALTRFGKSSEPAPQLDALQDVIEQIKKLVVSLSKQKKALGDKTFGEAKDKLYALLDAAESQEKDLRAKVDATEQDAEEDTPALLTSSMVPLVRLLQKGDLTMYGLIALAGKKTAVLIMRRDISPARRKLLSAYLQETSGLKFIKAECAGASGELHFMLDSAPGGLAKRVRAAIYEQTQLRVRVYLEFNGESETDDEEDDERRTATGGDTAAEDEPSSQEPTPEAKAYQELLARLKDPLKQALRDQHAESTKLRALIGMASDKADGQQDYASALLALRGIEKLLGPRPGGPAPGTTAQAPAAAPSSAPRDKTFVALQQSRLAWEAARTKALADLKRLRQAILDDFDGEPEFEEASKAAGVVGGALGAFDQTLTALLDRALDATEATRRQDLHREAGVLVKRYQADLAADPLLNRLDDNPFVPVAIQKSLDAALSYLSRQLV